MVKPNVKKVNKRVNFYVRCHMFAEIKKRCVVFVCTLIRVVEMFFYAKYGCPAAVGDCCIACTSYFVVRRHCVRTIWLYQSSVTISFSVFLSIRLCLVLLWHAWNTSNPSTTIFLLSFVTLFLACHTFIGCQCLISTAAVAHCPYYKLCCFSLTALNV